MKKIAFLFIVLGLLTGSCGSSKKAATSKSDNVNNTKIHSDNNPTDTKYDERDIDMLKYIARYKSIAQREMKEFGIPASITIAQGILESQAGKSDLATKANNHFGVKCHSDWQGQKYLHDDDQIQECFRKYKNAEHSYVDHSRFLAHRKRYAFLFRLPKTDYEAWAKGLKKAGYATDPSYPDKLIYLIEKFNLSKLDKEVLEGMSIKVDNNTNKEKKGSKKFIYEVKQGETLFTISSKFNIPVKKIQEINNLNDFDIYEGQILVLTSDNEVNDNNSDNDKTNTTETPVDTSDQSQDNTKENEVKEVVEQVVNTTEDTTATENTQHPDVSSIPEKERYEIKEGDTFFSLSKKFNISIDDLLSANNFDKSTKINVGQIIRIPLDKVQKTVTNTNVSAPKTDTEDTAVYHIVKPGETLYRIHVNYGVSVPKLRKLNHLKGNYIKVGQKIRVK